jgi:hypothetical protein
MALHSGKPELSESVQWLACLLDHRSLGLGFNSRQRQPSILFSERLNQT